MREILFRGKDHETGTWYEGQYIHPHKTTYCFKTDYDRDSDNDIHQIVFEQMTDWGLPNRHLRADVDPVTVGQYTGLTDKAGVKIFEGDILRWLSPDGESGKVFVRFAGGVFALQSIECPRADPDLFSDFEIGNQTLEVIGNICDDPELLESDEKEI